VPSQSAPVVAHQPGGDPEPPAEVEPSDVDEPAPGAVPAGDRLQDEVAERFPETQPGSAVAEEPPHLERGDDQPTAPGVGSHGGN
jgi:hypothetical protein